MAGVIVEAMLNSAVENHIVKHTFSGALSVRDLANAKMFTDWLYQDSAVEGVLWDFRLSLLTMQDEKYRSISKAIINPRTPTRSIKRAFLVTSQPHFERVQAVLGSIVTPWPWAVFLDEDKAIEWLESGSLVPSIKKA